MDVFTKAKRSELMGRIKSTNTKPELTVRRFLFANGYRYRIHQRNLPGKPDIVLKKYNLIIQVHGCFWHGHKNCKIFKMPKSNKTYWRNKIERNLRKDTINRKLLKKLGWRVIVIRECELEKRKISRTFNNLLKVISN